MKRFGAYVLALGILLIGRPLSADPVIHNFEIWGKRDQVDKLNIYSGWTNGFLQHRGPGGIELGKCLEKMSYEQAIAMIDKRYKDHPELWSHPLGEQILDALTVEGGPCEGKSPFKIRTF